MATAKSTFGLIVGQYFTDTILPHLEIYGEEEILTNKNQYIADSTTDPTLVATIEQHYGVTIW